MRWRKIKNYENRIQEMKQKEMIMNVLNQLLFSEILLLNKIKLLTRIQSHNKLSQIKYQKNLLNNLRKLWFLLILINLKITFNRYFILNLNLQINRIKSNQQINLFKQIKKITIQNQFQSQYIANSLKVVKQCFYEYNSFNQLFQLDDKDSIKILAKGLNEKVFASNGEDKVIKIWEKYFLETERAFQIVLKFDLEQQVSQVQCLTVCEGIQISKQKTLNLIQLDLLKQLALI
ncbi:unnamed protein product [Paramecium sonneborni]|uniref:Transmembrane protein n=1 Tax=Paramecium sonneborni TaxID=65129 RepID=A0A8S1M2N6_9CILI|nr:unnamed protein product [Paramecium sonneborni]